MAIATHYDKTARNCLAGIHVLASVSRSIEVRPSGVTRTSPQLPLWQVRLARHCRNHRRGGTL